jgi:hypothetical protein
MTVHSWEAAMLAEIYLLRLETLMRALEEATVAENFRFVPLNPASSREQINATAGKAFRRELDCAWKASP